MPTLGPFQCKDDHLMALARKVQALSYMVWDYRTGMINYFKFAHDFTICLDELQALSDLTLSDDPGPPDEPSDPPDEPSDPSALGPANPYCLKRFTERFCKEYEDRENYGKHLLNQFLLPPIL